MAKKETVKSNKIKSKFVIMNDGKVIATKSNGTKKTYKNLNEFFAK